MKTRHVLYAICVSCFFCASVIAQKTDRDMTFLLTIESSASSEGSVAFRLAYAEGDSSGYQPLEFVKGTTPFRMKFYKPLLVLLASDSIGGNLIDVGLKHYGQYTSGGGVGGSGSLNMLRGEGNRAMYGLPKFPDQKR